MIDISGVIERCVLYERKAQQELYDKYAKVLLGICLRYSKDIQEAEDLLQESFIKIFQNIGNFSFNGSFDGWVKKITVNTALTNYRKTINQRNHQSIEDYLVVEKGSSFETDFMATELLFKILNELPDGYRTIFNLHAIEGYKHREIGEKLGIDRSTSKSQYSRAKAVIRRKLKNFDKL